VTAKVGANHQLPENNQKVGSKSGGYKDLDFKKVLDSKQNRSNTQPVSDAARLLELLQS